MRACAFLCVQFDYGSAGLLRRMEESRFEWITANLRDTKTEQTLGRAQPTATFDVPVSFGARRAARAGLASGTVRSALTSAPGSGGETTSVRVGLFGICTQHTPMLSWPGEGVRFEHEIDTAVAAVQGAEGRRRARPDGRTEWPRAQSSSGRARRSSWASRTVCLLAWRRCAAARA